MLRRVLQGVTVCKILVNTFKFTIYAWGVTVLRRHLGNTILSVCVTALRCRAITVVFFKLGRCPNLPKHSCSGLFFLSLAVRQTQAPICAILWLWCWLSVSLHFCQGVNIKASHLSFPFSLTSIFAYFLLL